ncbi:hypothetical protein E2C01_038471 [Portunus trituberculatus]|uniref:Uncharacterized protein n=1 Tax=Portunus trituberculatus TaxID=210409 RepID=A0A5B7FCB3_PORTR|nr:hypothetical protein [Portunus trituberculatus]
MVKETISTRHDIHFTTDLKQRREKHTAVSRFECLRREERSLTAAYVGVDPGPQGVSIFVG